MSNKLTICYKDSNKQMLTIGDLRRGLQALGESYDNVRINWADFSGQDEQVVIRFEDENHNEACVTGY